MATINDYNDCVTALRQHIVSQDNELTETLNELSREGFTGAPAPGSKQDQWMNALYQYYMANMLSGPPTQAVNLSSNAVNVVMRPLSTLNATMWDSILPNEGDRVFMKEALAEIHGMAVGIDDAFEFLNHMIRNPGTAFEQTLNAKALPRQMAFNSKLEQYYKAISPELVEGTVLDNAITRAGLDWLGAAFSLPGTFLTAGDVFFKIVNFRMHQHKIAMRSTLNGGLDTQKLDAFKHDAVAAGEYHTFTSAPVGKLSKLFTGSQDSIGWLRWFIPFRRTIANVVTYGIEHSIAAPLSARFRANIRAGSEAKYLADHRSSVVHTTETAQMIKEGGARRAEALGRLSAGSLVIAGLAVLLDGRLDGSGPKTEQERAAWLANGHKQDSIRIGDSRIPIKMLGAIAPFIQAWANYSELVQNIRADEHPDFEQTIGNAAATMLFETAEALFDTTWLPGFTDFLTLVRRSIGYESPEAPDRARAAAAYADKMASNFVPYSAMARPEIQRWWQQYRVDHGDALGQPFSRTRELLGAWREDLSSSVGLWGDFIHYDNYLDPAYQDSVSGKDEVYNEMMRLGVRVPRAERQREGVYLTPDQFRQYMILAGKGSPNGLALRDGIIRLMSTKLYNGAETTDAGRAILIEALINDYRKQATSLLKATDPAFAEAARKAKLVKPSQFKGGLK